MKFEVQVTREKTTVLRSLGKMAWGTPQEILLQMRQGLIVSRPYVCPSGRQAAGHAAERVEDSPARSNAREQTDKLVPGGGCITVENVLTKCALGYFIRLANASSTETQLERISYRL